MSTTALVFKSLFFQVKRNSTSTVQDADTMVSAATFDQRNGRAGLSLCVCDSHNHPFTVCLLVWCIVRLSRIRGAPSKMEFRTRRIRHALQIGISPLPRADRWRLCARLGIVAPQPPRSPDLRLIRRLDAQGQIEARQHLHKEMKLAWLSLTPCAATAHPGRRWSPSASSHQRRYPEAKPGY